MTPLQGYPSINQVHEYLLSIYPTSVNAQLSGNQNKRSTLTACDGLTLTERSRHTHPEQLLVTQSQSPTSMEVWTADLKCAQMSVRVDWNDQVIPGGRLWGWGTLILSTRSWSEGWAVQASSRRAGKPGLWSLP